MYSYGSYVDMFIVLGNDLLKVDVDTAGMYVAHTSDQYVMTSCTYYFMFAICSSFGTLLRWTDTSVCADFADRNTVRPRI